MNNKIKAELEKHISSKIIDSNKLSIYNEAEEIYREYIISQVYFEFMIKSDYLLISDFVDSVEFKKLVDSLISEIIILINYYHYVTNTKIVKENNL